MTTNYERYFSSPEKASEMQVSWEFGGRNGHGENGWTITRFDMNMMGCPQEVAFLPCDDDDPAILYGWMTKQGGGEHHV